MESASPLPAFSIQELAVIRGDQLTAADLVPIFSGFLKDLVKDKRRVHLCQLPRLVVTDSSPN